MILVKHTSYKDHDIYYTYTYSYYENGFGDPRDGYYLSLDIQEKKLISVQMKFCITNP